MKIKVLPEDFQVEELLKLRLSRHGRHTVYRLEKRNRDTIGVLGYLESKYRLGRLSRAGLKDRYACTVQYVSTQTQGPDRIVEPDFTLKRIGNSNLPVTRDLLLGNQFRITLRDLTRREVAITETNLPALLSDGFANYHDDQRFGSARPGHGFVARKLVDGDFEGALRLCLAAPDSDDPEPERRNREFMTRNWGDWERCAARAKPEYTLAVRHLRRSPGDFAGAICRIRRDLLDLFIASYQSYIWNETLARLLRGFDLPLTAVPYRLGEMLFFRSLNPPARRFFSLHDIPVISPASPLKPALIAHTVDQIVRSENLRLRDLKLHLQIPGLRFKPYARPGIVIAQRLQVSEPVPDELHPNRLKQGLVFELPPGGFATVLVRRLQLL